MQLRHAQTILQHHITQDEHHIAMNTLKSNLLVETKNTSDAVMSRLVSIQSEGASITNGAL